MPLPLVPVAGFAIRYGAMALAAYAVTRAVGPAVRDQRAEDAMDDTPEGLGLRRDGEQRNAAARLRRVVRFGSDGPAFEIDATLLGRFRVRRI